MPPNTLPEQSLSEEERGPKSRLSSATSPKSLEPSFEDEDLFCSEDKSSSNGDGGGEPNKVTAEETTELPESIQAVESVPVVAAVPASALPASTTLPTTSL